MKKICGIELKGKQANIAVITSEGDEWQYVETKLRKITLEDDESGASVRAFYEHCVDFLKTEEIDHVVIKKRNKKGNFAGGPLSFKMEGLLQLAFEETQLLAAASISASHKKHNYSSPSSLKKYQQQAFLTACAFHTQQNK